MIHTNKGNGTEPLMRISGSIGFTGAARSVLLAADDPQDEGRHILAVVKSNLADMPAPLAFRLTGVVLEAYGLMKGDCRSIFCVPRASALPMCTS